MNQSLQIGREHLQKLLESAFVLQQGEPDADAPLARELPAAANHPAEFRALIAGLPAMLSQCEIDLDEAFDLIALHLQRSTEADGVAAALLEGGDVLYHAATGLSRSLYGIRVRPEATLFHGLLRAGETLTSPETSDDTRLDHMLCQLRGARSLVVTPIVQNGVMVGAWEVVAERGYAFSPAAEECCGIAATVAGECLVASDWEPDVQEREDLAAWAKAQPDHASRHAEDHTEHVTSDALLHAEAEPAWERQVAAMTHAAPVVPSQSPAKTRETSSEPTHETRHEPRHETSHEPLLAPSDSAEEAAPVSSNWLVRQWQTNRANFFIVAAIVIIAIIMLSELASAMGWLEGSESWLGTISALSGISDSEAGVIPPPQLSPQTFGSARAPVWISLLQGQYYCAGPTDVGQDARQEVGFFAQQRAAQLAHYSSAQGTPCP